MTIVSPTKPNSASLSSKSDDKIFGLKDLGFSIIVDTAKSFKVTQEFKA